MQAPHLNDKIAIKSKYRNELGNFPPPDLPAKESGANFLSFATTVSSEFMVKLPVVLQGCKLNSEIRL